ncbi:D-alanyl-D-alanine carboxypeptidase family protein [Erysipelotrichaceae bacterium OttesenSCG-928-M19]|nr:D-alanyl-D-alanine carboxypeptidase family protein [Erysipelotrichaceae bacterium OttesenSCG-928-M19]
MKLRRRHILIYVIVISVVSLIIVSQSYDKYSRNPSINSLNREVIENYLSDEDKKYLIDNNLNVNLFLSFIKEKGFSLQNYEYYNVVQKYYPKMKKAAVVKQTNLLVDENFTLNSLNNIFKNELYSLDQLISLANKPSSYFPEAKPEFYPNNAYALSNTKHYIADYKPNDLVKLNKAYTLNKSNIELSNEANKQLMLMCDNLKVITEQECGGLKIKYGYISYKNTNKYTKELAFIKPGHNEFQLGKTIEFNKSENFNKNKLYLWLLDNSYRYGFVQRYPDDKTNHTGVSNHYGVFRYVGVNEAKNLIQNNKTIEEQRGE